MTARAASRGVFHAVAGGVALTLYAIVVVPVARLAKASRRKSGSRPRILWGPIPIINIRYGSTADRLQGFESATLVYGVYSINARDQFDYVLDRASAVPFFGKLVPYAAFLWAGLRYDVFVFYYDGGLLHATPWWRAELALLRLAGHAIVVLPYGGDARIASTTRTRGPWNAYTEIRPEDEDRDERDVGRRVATFGRYANAVMGCADIYEDLPRVDGMFRYPYDSRGVQEWVARDADPVRIVHAPNHRHYKGTRYLLDAVEQLRGEGLDIELDLVEGVPNDEARRRYAEADIIADQFLLGAYALFAIEGMAVGNPVVCYLNERFVPMHPEWAECPILSASPDDLADVLRRLLTDPGLRRELGSRGPGYVEKWHSLESVGRDMAVIYERVWR